MASVPCRPASSPGPVPVLTRRGKTRTPAHAAVELRRRLPLAAALPLAVRSIRRSLIRRQCGVELPPCACHGKLCGTDVYIIGTAHISPQSARDVEELIEKVKPDAVVVELSRDRIGSLYPSGATESRTGSLQLDLDTTPEGFPVVLRAQSSESDQDGQLILRTGDQVDYVKMRLPLSSFGDGTWLETAFAKHRYRSDSVKIWPAIELMITLANQLFPMAQRAFYSSVSRVSHSGGEFAAAARSARRLRCPIVLADVENEDLFDPLGALEVTKEDPLWVRLAGPLVRPEAGGVDLLEALKHVFNGSTKKGTGARLGALYVLILSYGFYLDERANAVDLSSVLPLLAAMSATNTLVAGSIVFLLTATRDERLFRALREACRAHRGTVVMVCGVAHVNGIARHVAKASSTS